MTAIKNIIFKNDIISIVDENNKKFSISTNDKKIVDILPSAYKETKHYKGLYKYFKLYFVICLICIIFCTLGCLIPVFTNSLFIELYLILYGSLDACSIILAVISKKYYKWLEKKQFNNEYWKEIYDIVSHDVSNSDFAVTKKSSYNYSKTDLNKNINYHLRKEGIIQDFVSISNRVNASDGTYHYNNSEIIQDYSKDKVKTYKKF